MAANEIFNDLNIVLQLNQHIQGVSVSGNGARILSPPPAGSLAKQTSFKVLTNLDSVSYSEPREDAQFDHQRSIFLSVSSCDLPFHLQGDKDFNEASAMAKRRALRFSELVKSRIEFLWEVAGGKKQAEMAQRIRQKQLEENDQGRGRRGEQSVRRAGAANELKQLLPPLEELDEEDYMALMLLIFKVLRDDFVLELAQKQIQCDWEVDSHHGKTLSFDQFFAAVFELVDVWTCDMEEVTYERFVHLLARRITRRVAVFLDGAELKLSLSDNFEPEVVWRVESESLQLEKVEPTVVSAADANVVNALRSTFLIEKAISIERQTELPAIRDELTKFGVDVDPAKLPEETVKDRYNALYDMLVLRDGESLKTLASVMLEQIKLELSVHGIIVDDEEDVEEVYDGFFASVVTGTGESIVQDAQRWMEGTVQGNKVNDYIQHDFHELESIDGVKPLGTRRGDEEFQSLLAKGTDDIADDAAESTNRPQGRKNSSPIQRKPSRVLAVPLPVVVTSQENQSRPPGPVEKSLPHSSQPEQVVAAVKENAAHGSSENQKMAKKKKPGHDKSSDPPPPSDQAPASADGARRQSGEIQQETLPATSRKPKLTISTLDSMQCSASDDTESASSGPPVEAADNSAPDDPKHKRPAGISRHGRPGTGFEVDGAIDGKKYHDTSEQHTTRDALNIAIEFEEDDSTPGALSSRVDGERSVSMEPKVPQIVIGGASSAGNVPVTGRYIQLLGVGTVLITKGEREFFQLLRSHEGLKTDLYRSSAMVQTIQERVGNRVILFGGNTDEPGKTQQVALECLAHGALHFANIPFDFPRLREKIISFFENSKQPYILRQRKPPGQAAHVGSTIGAGSLFALHDEPPLSHYLKG
uniref:Uncharacterized protein n=1 Tax=Phytophthora ramorum TaxID=164328 RepID=H3GY75_PHYRM